jgi:segregation and condensation protein B
LENKKNPVANSDIKQENRDKILLEGALYASGRPLNLKELGSVLKTKSKKRIKKGLETIKREYNMRDTALEILELKDEKYVLQLRVEFTPLIKKLVNRPLLTSGPLKTLSYIAYRQPTTQKKVIEVRGQHAYGHIKILREIGLIENEKKGRSTIIRTSEYFSDYFGLSQNINKLKKELKNVFNELRITKS